MLQWRMASSTHLLRWGWWHCRSWGSRRLVDRRLNWPSSSVSSKLASFCHFCGRVCEGKHWTRTHLGFVFFCFSNQGPVCPSFEWRRRCHACPLVADLEVVCLLHCRPNWPSGLSQSLHQREKQSCIYRFLLFATFLGRVCAFFDLQGSTFKMRTSRFDLQSSCRQTLSMCNHWFDTQPPADRQNRHRQTSFIYKIY